MTGPLASAWLGGALRRPGRAVVIVLALTVMTLATVAAFVAADSLDELFLADARAEWGPVDVEVTSASGATFGESTARLVGGEAFEVTQEWAPRTIFPAVARSGGRSEPDTLLLGLGAEEQFFPDLQVVDGRGGIVDILTLQPDEAVVNQRLARRLALDVGAELSVLVAVPEVRRPMAFGTTPEVSSPTTVPLPLRVAGIVADMGVADLHRTPNVLVRRDVLQVFTQTEGLVTHLHLAAPEDDRDSAQEVIRTFESPLREFGLVAAEVKADALDVAEDEGGQFRSILLTLAVLAIGAAVVATVNLLIALGQERVRELALLRVAGLPDRAAARLVAAEAAVYAPVGVVLGMLVGIPLGGFVAGGLADRFAEIGAGRGREQVALELAVQPVTLAVAAAVVLVAAVLAGRSAGRELAAVPLDDTLRGVPGYRSRRPAGLLRPVATLALGAVLFGMGLTANLGGDALRYLGVTLVLTAGWLWWRRQAAAPGAADRPAALLAIIWSLGGAALLADFSQGYETGFGILAVAAAVAISAATVLAVHGLRHLVKPLAAVVTRRRLRAAFYVATSYAAAATRRSGATMAVVGIVLFMVAALNVLGSAAAIDVERQGGGYDVLATTAAPVDPAALAGLGEVEDLVALDVGVVPETAYRVEDADEVAFTVRYPVRLIPAADALLTTQEFGLADALPGYDSADDALRAVRDDDNKAVVDRYARPEGSSLGDDVVIDNGRGPRRYELIAVLDTFLLGGVVIPQQELPSIVSSTGPTFVLASARGGTTAAELAASLQASGVELGMDARPMAEVAEDLVEVNRTFTDLFTLMVLLGLVVAVAAEGALVLRAARERRAELAVMRSVGMRGGTVALTLVLERLVMAFLGGVVGVVVGLGVLRVLFAAGFSDLAFVVDWARLGAVAVGVLLLLAVATVAAAVPARRQDPASGLSDLG